MKVIVNGALVELEQSEISALGWLNGAGICEER